MGPRREGVGVVTERAHSDNEHDHGPVLGPAKWPHKREGGGVVGKRVLLNTQRIF